VGVFQRVNAYRRGRAERRTAWTTSGAAVDAFRIRLAQQKVLERKVGG
jgi:hypothetical protein